MFNYTSPLRCFLLVLSLGSSALSAQEVLFSSPQWVDPAHPGADTLPALKSPLKHSYPSSLEGSKILGYSITLISIDSEGDTVTLGQATLDPFKVDTIKGLQALTPAQKEGQATGSITWISAIFNPQTERQARKEGGVRLLAVAPLFLDAKEYPELGDKLAWARIVVEANGQAQLKSFDTAAHEVLRAKAEVCLASWKFSPARKGAVAIVSEIHLPFMLQRPWKPKVMQHKPTKWPVPISQERPKFPLALSEELQSGEVVLDFVVNREGRVQNPVVVRTTHPGFNAAATEALLKWRFAPAELANGKTVNARMSVPIQFSIEGADPRPFSDSGNGKTLNARRLLPLQFIFGGADPRAFSQITEPEKKNQDKLPPELKYDVVPGIKNVVLPVYPYALLKADRGGKVSVKVVIDPQGRPGAVQLIKSDAPELLDAYTAAVETFQFTPALRDNKAVPCLLVCEMEFTTDFRRDDRNLCTVTNRTHELLRKEAKKPESIVSIKELDKPLKPLSRMTPISPLSAKAPTGEAMIEFLVDEDGKVYLPRIVSATEPCYGYAAIQAVASWRFEEPTKQGISVVVRAKVPIRFSVKK